MVIGYGISYVGSECKFSSNFWSGVYYTVLIFIVYLMWETRFWTGSRTIIPQFHQIPWKMGPLTEQIFQIISSWSCVSETLIVKSFQLSAQSVWSATITCSSSRWSPTIRWILTATALASRDISGICSTLARIETKSGFPADNKVRRRKGYCAIRILNRVVARM